MKLEKGKQNAEAFVFVREDWMPLRYRPLPDGRIEVDSHADRRHAERMVYEEGIDFEADIAGGRIRRTPGSRIPDWSRHPLYGIPHFDHALFANCGNKDFTVYASYRCSRYEREERRSSGGEIAGGVLARWTAKLQAGEETLYVVYGDSISAGGDASAPGFAYGDQFLCGVRERYPGSRTRLINKAKGGETSLGGKERIDREVISLRPDLVSIGYGMNDQNLYEHGVDVPPPAFESNFRYMIEAVLKVEGCALALVTPCSPNPLWRYASGRMSEYAEVIRRLGTEYGVAVADVHAAWERELAAGKTPECLLLNNINHPNDYGHLLYAKALIALLPDDGEGGE